MSNFFHGTDDNDDTQAIPIPRVFSENSRAKNWDCVTKGKTTQHNTPTANRFPLRSVKYLILKM